MSWLMIAYGVASVAMTVCALAFLRGAKREPREPSLSWDEMERMLRSSVLSDGG